MKRQIPLIIVFACGVLMCVQFFVPAEASGDLKDFMSDWLIITGIFAMPLGIWSLIRVSSAKIRRRSENWQYAIITLVGLFAMIFFGIQWPWINYYPEHPTREYQNRLVTKSEEVAPLIEQLTYTLSLEPDVLDTTILAKLEEHIDSVLYIADYFSGEGLVIKDSMQQVTLGELSQLQSSNKMMLEQVRSGDSLQRRTALAKLSENSDSTLALVVSLGSFTDKTFFVGGLASYMFRSFFNYIVIPIQATMFSLLAFFIASAAYRAFRARSLLATVLLGAAIILMMRLLPMGPLTGPLNDLSSWILLVPNLAAKRAILMGVGLGMVATALKVVLGIERSYLGRD